MKYFNVPNTKLDAWKDSFMSFSDEIRSSRLFWIGMWLNDNSFFVFPLVLLCLCKILCNFYLHIVFQTHSSSLHSLLNFLLILIISCYITKRRNVQKKKLQNTIKASFEMCNIIFLSWKNWPFLLYLLMLLTKSF